MVVHKKKGGETKFYLLDSGNLKYLNCEEEHIPVLYDEQLHEHVALGFPRKKFDTFTTKMVLHSMIDLRRTFEVIIDVFKSKDKNELVNYYNKWFLHNKLKHFWNYTKHLRQNGNDIDVPNCKMSLNEKQQLNTFKFSP